MNWISLKIGSNLIEPLLGDKDNWISLKIPPECTCHALALHLNNDEDRGFVTNKVTIKVGNVPKVLKQLTYTDVGVRYCGWLWYEISGYCQIELHFTGNYWFYIINLFP